jgi:hypothetical protein
LAARKFILENTVNVLYGCGSGIWGWGVLREGKEVGCNMKEKREREKKEGNREGKE